MPRRQLAVPWWREMRHTLIGFAADSPHLIRWTSPTGGSGSWVQVASPNGILDFTTPGEATTITIAEGDTAGLADPETTLTSDPADVPATAMLTVYTVDGRTVGTWSRSREEMRSGDILPPGADLPSGVYFWTWAARRGKVTVLH
jgi:hypothetical protein